MVRKGRDRCTGRRRDGQPCQATAIEGGFVCPAHGGGAPQVQIAARRRVLQLRYLEVYEAWQADRGIPGQLTKTQFDLLVRASDAQRALEQFERDVTLIRLMRAEVADPHPETTAALLEIARERLDAMGARTP